MATHHERPEHRQLTSILIFVAALVATALVYRPGLGGSIFFDDPHNLDGLARISDLSSALRYIFGGQAGPLGRPLALASFAAQAYAWPNGIALMLYTNVCIHLLNGVLVTWMLLLLLEVSGRAEQAGQGPRVAAIGGALWMLMPLLASSSLLVVQRMTSLSATFVLAGGIGYLYGRAALERRPRVAFSIMVLALTVGTGLAALAKENGALLPLLVLVTELTILTRPAGDRARSYRRRLLGLLGLPALALGAYLVWRADYSEGVVTYRGFSGAERLLTEAHILWEYLLNAFFPAVVNLGPFHDDHAVYTEWLQPSSLLAVGGWLVLVAAAIAFKKTLPMLSFAVGWYLVGHSIESTTVPLELYFEHRNYIPIIGPVLAVVFAADCEARKVWLIRPALFAYIVMLGIVLLSLTSLWGRPLLAAQMWSLYNPESARAVQYLSEQYARAGNETQAYRVMQARLEQRPSDVNSALRVLGLACLLYPDADQNRLLKMTTTELERGGYVAGITRPLVGLHLLAKEKRCSAITLDTVDDLASAAARNPAYRSVEGAMHDINFVLAEQALAQRNSDLAIHHLELALSSRYTIEALTRAVQVLKSAGRDSAALDLLNEALEKRPANPLRAPLWIQQVANLRAYVGPAGKQ